MKARQIKIGVRKDAKTTRFTVFLNVRERRVLNTVAYLKINLQPCLRAFFEFGCTELTVKLKL